MRVTGIICEYNPYHLGHLFQMKESVKQLGEETAVVCAMSGNFVQRGEPAVFSKFARAEAAVKCGADLVIELPSFVSLNSAEGFAKGGVKLLDSLGVCTHLSFGSEAGDIKKLNDTALALLSPQMDEMIKSELAKGLSYAVSRQNALEKIMGKAAEIISKPNNILAVEYLKALKTVGSEMLPVTVSRQGGDHDGAAGYSASAVRRALEEGDAAFACVPEKAREVFAREISQGRGPVFTKDIENPLLYRLRTMTEEDFEKLPFSGEGLGMRLCKSVKTSGSLAEILEKTKTKRYAMSRIRRMVMCAYLGLTKDDMLCEPRYIRVLGAGKRGRELLAKMRETAKLPVIVKPASARELLRDTRETDLYTLAYRNEKQRICGADFTTSPYIEK